MPMKKKKEKKRRLLKWETLYMSPKRKKTGPGYEQRTGNDRC